MGFSQLILTNAALTAINRVVADGASLKFVRVSVGSGYASTNDKPETFTSLKNEVMPASITSANSLVLYQTTIRADLKSEYAPYQFQINEVGVWYSLDGATEFLFAYSSTGPQGQGDFLTPSGQGDELTKDYVLPIVYSRDCPVTSDITLISQVQLHAETHLSTGIDPIPVAGSSVGGLCPVSPGDGKKVLISTNPVRWAAVPLHAPTHLDNGIDPLPIATTQRTGSLPKLSGDPGTVLTGVGTWGSGRLAGEIIDFAGPNPPPGGWLPCSGQAVSRLTYSALFAAIGGYWGNGDGSTTFNLPDLRGRATIGSGAGAGLTNRGLGQYGGEENHTLTTNEMPWHGHGVSDPQHIHSIDEHGGHQHPLYDPGHSHYLNTEQGPKYQIGNYGAYGLIDATGGPTAVVTWGWTNISCQAANTNISINGGGTGIAIYGAGGSWPHANMQPFAVVTKWIKY
jgi:microcystin-dependent protein